MNPYVPEEAARYWFASNALRELGWEGVGYWWWRPGFGAGPASLELALKVEKERIAFLVLTRSVKNLARSFSRMSASIRPVIHEIRRSPALED